MSLRDVTVLFALLVLVFADRNVVSADENNNNQMTLPMMSPPAKQLPPQNSGADRFYLNHYEAVVKDDLSLCKGEKSCVEDATVIQSWSCAADICNATNSTKNPLDCFNEPGIYGDRNVVASSLCDLIASPGPLTREKLLSHVFDPKATVDALVGTEAYLMALEDSGGACINHVKSYMGPYGPTWTYKWYRTIAGCRIVSREGSREELEQAFSYWYDENSCSSISDDELREACDASGGVLSLDDHGQ